MNAIIDQDLLDSMVYNMIGAIPQSDEAKKAEAESLKLFEALDVKIRGKEPHNMELGELIDACANEICIAAHDAFLNGLKIGLRLGF